LTGKPIYTSGRKTILLCTEAPSHRAKISASSENGAMYCCKAQEGK